MLNQKMDRKILKKILLKRDKKEINKAEEEREEERERGKSKIPQFKFKPTKKINPNRPITMLTANIVIFTILLCTYEIGGDVILCISELFNKNGGIVI